MIADDEKNFIESLHLAIDIFTMSIYNTRGQRNRASGAKAVKCLKGRPC
jgi:hypothetical protein